MSGRARGAVGVLSVVIAAVAALGPGCAAGPGIVVPTGEDGAEVRLDDDAAAVWDATVAVADEWGTVTAADPEIGFVEAREGDTTVAAEVSVLESGEVRARFRARRLGATIPDRERAQILAENLARRLARS